MRYRIIKRLNPLNEDYFQLQILRTWMGISMWRYKTHTYYGIRSACQGRTAYHSVEAVMFAVKEEAVQACKDKRTYVVIEEGNYEL